MAFSQGKSRPFQTTMAVTCLLLASGGFVGAGYVNNSVADAAILAAQQSSPMSPTASTALAADFNAVAAQELGVQMSFAHTLISAQKPAAPQFLDLTDPTANTPHLARNVQAMRADIPEISRELISQVRKDILAAAYRGLGHPYVWGGTSFDNGWDCSGFVQWAYRQAGVTLPRTEQWLPMVETRNPQPGDIVVQNPDGPNHWSHIGIYIGGGLMISALNPSVGTILHAPGDASSSSSYFTLPAFAEADAKAKVDAKATAGPESPHGSAGPAAPKTTNPGGTGTGTGDPETTPSTAAPSTTMPPAPPSSTPPRTAPPSTTPPSNAPPIIAPPSTAPTSPRPATTKPGPTPTAPETSAPATKSASAHPTGEQSTSSRAQTTAPSTAAFSRSGR